MLGLENVLEADYNYLILKNKESNM